MDYYEAEQAYWYSCEQKAFKEGFAHGFVIALCLAIAGVAAWGAFHV